ncbi:MAG TPA: CDC27 family protein, partial [Exilispira sp.]|nr:CDC27 family protein [Exilispira sp.]
MEIDSKSLYIQAIKLVQQKQFARANMIFQSLIKNNVTDEQIIYYYGYSLIELNEYEKALKLYRQYLSINSK